jgi:hypothetical protein
MADGLLNKASIILTSTGYKAGTLYNVAPVVEPYEDFDFARASVASRVNSSGLVEMVGRTLGSELVTNGDFATDSDWTLGTGWSIEDGKANVDTASNNRIEQDGIVSDGNTYAITFTILNYNSGSIRLRLGNTYGEYTSGNGTYTQYIQCTTNDKFRIYASSSGADLSIDNVSVKEVIDTNNIPRISYDSNGDNGHILLEPTSTNKVTYSENFTQWIKTSGVTITSNYGISPDGTQNSTRLQLSSNNEQVYKSISHSGNTETATLFVKGTSGETIQFGVGNNISQGGTYTLNGQWQRIEQQNTSGSVFIIGNKDLTATDFEVWGAQLEELSYATSYIPTLTGSTETRATETATGAGSADLINSTEGVLYAEIAGLVDADASDRVISLSDNSITNRVEMKLSSSGSIQGRFDSAADDITLTEAGVTASNFNKIALVWSSGKCALFINGVKEQEDLTFNTFASDVLLDLSFDSAYLGGSSNFYGKCKALAVFNEALSDSELTQLTT